MNSVLRIYILLFIITFQLLLLNGRSEDIRFKHLTIDNGLSQSAVFSILQDKQGFMWFGSKDGLNRYDGYEFKVFLHNAFDSSSISANYITSLFEDRQGWLWIGTKDGGLNKYYPETETFQRIPLVSANPQDSLVRQINAIIEDFDGNIWIGTQQNGLFCIPNQGTRAPNKNSHIQFLKNPNFDKSISNNTVNTLEVDSGGFLWIGTDSGLDILDTKNDTVYFDHVTIVTKNPKAPVSPKDSSVTAIFEDSKRTLWLGTTSGIGKFDLKNKKLEFFPHHYEIYRYGWGQVKDIVEDQEGNLWLATPGELMRFDPEKKKYDYFRHDPFQAQSISYNGVSSLYWDRSSDLFWVGTPGAGINVYDPKARRFSTLVRKADPSSRISGFSVRSVLEDNQGTVWVSTDVLYRWNRRSGEVKSFETSSDRLYDFGNTGIWSMIQSTGGEIWCATSEGLFSYYPQTESTKLYKYNPANSSGLRQKSVFAVFEDRAGKIWIASENYLSRLDDIEHGRFRHYRYNKIPAQNEIMRPVIYQDEKGGFWLGTKNGLLKFDPSTGSFFTYRNNPAQPTSLNHNSIKSICPDPRQPDKILWLGTDGGGLNRFDIEANTFTHITEKNGLPNNVVYGILPDNDGNLWMSTNKGLSCYNPVSGKFKNYDVYDGLQSNEFNNGAYYRTKTGEMFFGGIKGLNYFNPWEVKDNPHIPEIVITGLKLKNQSISHKTKDSVLKEPISQTKHLTLSHHENIITFEFAALDYSVPEKNQFSYKLENFSRNWIFSERDRSATYTNLPAGDYMFRVRGSNNDGVWNMEGTSLKLTIMPPWWETWWAYSLYAIALILVLFSIRRFELSRIQLKSRIKIGQIESNKLKELDHLKSRFFANISHEFRTPLTLILGQIKSVMTSRIDMEEKGKLQVALRNSRRLLDLINQLLDLSKLEAGSLKLKAECGNLVSFAKNLFYSFDSLAKQKNITLHFKCEWKEIPVFFEADKMEKVFYNIISNALKFTPNGGRIEVEVYREIIGETENPRRGEIVPLSGSPDSPFSGAPDLNTGEYVQFKIRDNGIGIAADQVPHIFDHFYQVDNSHTRDHQGSGIGLALTKELVELHHGQISVNSKEGIGTEFIIYLPISDTQTQVEAKPKPANAAPQIHTHSWQNEESINKQLDRIHYRRPAKHPLEIILIIEDNSDVRGYIHELLEMEYRIIEADNGKIGIDKARQFIPDLIITDVMMPRMHGYEFCRQIRSDEKTSHIPIIILTAKAALGDKIEGLETGADDYLTKPFSAKELQVRVKNLLLQRKQLQERFRKTTDIKPSEVSARPIDQVFLEKTIKIIESHFEYEQFAVEKLADKMNISVSQLNRKLNALVGQPAGQLVRSLRLQRAADLLKKNAGTVAEICYLVGFNDQAYFSRSFKKQFGYTPSAYRKG